MHVFRDKKNYLN